MKKRPELISCERQFEIGDLFALNLSLSQLVDSNILRSPDTRSPLKIRSLGADLELFDETNVYSIHEGCPLLYPKVVLENWGPDNSLPFKTYDNPLLQYILLSQIKQSGEINAPINSVPARKHQWRYKNFCANLKGVVLDVGSDRPSHSIQFLPAACEYIGLDPYAGRGEFRLIGMGEILPLTDESVDAVTFNTSLDHILDYHTAVTEAHRVLKNSGTIIIATYAWIEKATLLTDSVHFHHFREFELFGALENLFRISDVKRYEDPKHASHRYGLYISATKR